MRISDWSSDVCSSDLDAVDAVVVVEADVLAAAVLVVEEEIDVALRLAAEIDVRQPDAVSHVLDHSMFLFLLGVCLRSYCRATRRSPRGVSARSTSSNTPCTSSASSAAGTAPSRIRPMSSRRMPARIGWP